MTVYKRPNLSPLQCSLVESLLKEHLSNLDFDNPDFDGAYQTYVKVRDAKEISTKRA